MRAEDWRRIQFGFRFGLLALLAGALMAPKVAYAQDAEFPSNAETHPGEIVYETDVPYGSATRRFVKGEASTVAPDQSRLIIDTLLAGLTPVSDAEQASISAPITRGLSLGNEAIDAGLSVLTRSTGNVDFARSENGGSSTGNIISQSLSVLPSALAVIGQTAGGGQ